MTRRMAGDAEVLRLLAADRDRVYMHGELTDEDLGTPGYNEEYEPEELIAALEDDSADPRYEYVVDPHGYGSYQRRATTLGGQEPDAAQEAVIQQQAQAYIDRLLANQARLEAEELATVIEAKGYSPQDARLMAANYLGEGGEGS